MTTPSLDTLNERVEGMREDLRDFGAQLHEHRRESAESSEKTREVLDEIKVQLSALAETRKLVDELKATVQGEKNEPGLTTRQDRSERTIFVMLWVVGAVTLCTIGSIVSWIGDRIHFLTNLGAKP